MPPEDEIPTLPQVDSDGDKLPDQLELLIGTNLLDADTDDDGLTDGYEYFSHRGLDPKKADSDDDLADDGFELEMGTQPNTPDTDGDKILHGNHLFPLDDTNTFGGPSLTPPEVTDGPITSPSQVPDVEAPAPMPHPNGLEPIDPYSD